MSNTKSTIILFRGMPGVGKTFLSDTVSEKLKIAVIHKDDIYDSIYADTDSHDSRNKICYDLIYRVIDSNVKTGADLIIDCPFREHHDLDKLNDFISSRRGIFKPVLCECRNEALWAMRFNERSAHPKPNNLLVDFNALKAHYQNLQLARYRDELVLNTADDIGSLTRKVMEYR